MARAIPLSYDLVFNVEFETNIRGHYVYKSVWTPILAEQLKCMKDDREEAKDHDEIAIGVCKINAETEDLFVGHIPCEISKLIHCFLKSDKFNSVVATVTGKRKREMSLVVPARSFAKILQNVCKDIAQGTGEEKNIYSYLELNVVDFVDKKKIEYF